MFAGSFLPSSFSILVIASFWVFSSADEKSLHLVSPPWLATLDEHPVASAAAARPAASRVVNRFMADCYPMTPPAKPWAASDPLVLDRRLVAPGVRAHHVRLEGCGDHRRVAVVLVQRYRHRERAGAVGLARAARGAAGAVGADDLDRFVGREPD